MNNLETNIKIRYELNNRNQVIDNQIRVLKNQIEEQSKDLLHQVVELKTEASNNKSKIRRLDNLNYKILNLKQ